ncbi:L-histidine N(alpha)-methyltransferase [Roseovarius sp. D0-M9]|uniref:L-histidine N(alpha)-methyltransferase n=1 Tax=Roseovarius sp. D0-M9 TaxID=3127117 RepID=UPI00300FDB8A
MDKPVVTNRALFADALAGLRADPKRMNPKWFYDHAGSALFERITELPEYYPTRTELSILRREVDTLSTCIPEGAALVELGSGASTKTRVLLDAIRGLRAYVPIDVSGDFLRDVASDLDRAYPGLRVAPLVGDFLGDLDLPTEIRSLPKIAFFPGSTIGNLEPAEALNLLRRVRAWPEVSAFILGLDLVKEPGILKRAYDDSAGVTAAFNHNLLLRLNREAGGTFDVDTFGHEARWNAEFERIEMHLVSKKTQEVSLGGFSIQFSKGESIHTENSHKYNQASIARAAAEAGWAVDVFLTDERRLFGVAILRPF